MMTNIQFEKELLLLNAEEGNLGIYELVLYQLAFHKKLKLAEKYELAIQILLELTKEGDIIIEKYEDNSLTKKIKEYSSENIGNLEEDLNTPQFWYISNSPHLIYTITEKGENYLDTIEKEQMNRLKMRF
jgi:predicted transcriptional regulator